MSDLYFNGKFLGSIENPDDFYRQVINERRKGVLSTELNIYINRKTKDLYVDSTVGRVRRPLIVVKEGKQLLTENHIKQLEKNEITWSDLIEQGVIEFIDAAEEENCLVAFSEEDLTIDHTHLEITPLAMLGYCTSLVPYGNFTQPARLMIGSKNQKQSLGLYVANFPLKIDMDVNVMNTPQRPVVQSIMHDISNYDSHPA